MDALARAVAEWRDETSFLSADDLPRTAVQRRPNWYSNVTRAALLERVLEREQLTARLGAAYTSGFGQWSASDQVDYWCGPPSFLYGAV